MTLYVDSSVVLRRVLGQADALGPLEERAELVTSGLTEVECLRTLDRLGLRNPEATDRIPALREAVFHLLDTSAVVEVSRSVLRRAGQSFSSPLGTLDAIHLSTALLWAEHRGEEPTMATHDRQLAVAARASGLSVVGV